MTQASDIELGNTGENEEEGSLFDSSKEVPEKGSNSFLWRHAYKIAVAAIVLVAVAVFLIAFFALRARKGGTDGDETFLELPDSPFPTRYNVRIHPSFDNFMYKGTVNITITVKNDTTSILLNAQNLRNLKASISGPVDPQSVKITVPVEGYIRLTPSVRLTPGEYTINMAFEGDITDNLYGIYRSRRVNMESEEYVISTYFGNGATRRAFPCWDEPQFQAIFKLTLTSSANMTMLSNMEEQMSSSDTGASDVVSLTYFDTPKISPHMLGFVIGKLGRHVKQDLVGVLHSFYSTSNEIQLGEYALLASVYSSMLYTRGFDIETAKNFIMVALGDSQVGAKTTWQLITSRDSDVFATIHSSLAQKREMINLVCRQTSLRWLGNLVTTKRWKDLWLSEGFASYFGYFCEESYVPEAEAWTRFLLTVKQAMLLDSLQATHPIMTEVNDSRQTYTIMDDIIYGKAASVVNMLQKYMGNNNFWGCLKQYLKKYTFESVDTEDLWDTISSTSKIDVKSVFDKWVKKTGVPYVKVSVQMSDGTTGELSLEQRKFLLNGAAEHSNDTWSLPISATAYTNSILVYSNFTLDTERNTFILSYINNDSWVKVNTNKEAYFIAMYDDSMLEKLKTAIVQRQLNASDRLDIQSDLYLLALAGYKNLSQYLEYLRSYMEETNIYVWQDITMNLNKIEMLMEYMNLDKSLDYYIIDLYRTIFGKVGWAASSDEPVLFPILRGLVIQQLCMQNAISVVAHAKALFEAALSDTLNQDLRLPILACNVRTGNIVQYNAVKEKYLNSASPAERKTLLTAMGYTKDEVAIDDLIKFSAMSGDVKIQDLQYPFKILGSTSLGSNKLLAYLKDNIRNLSKRFLTDQLILFYIKPAFNGFATSSSASDLEEFCASNGISKSNAVIKQVIERILIQEAIVRRSKDDIAGFLQTIQQ